MLDKHQLKNFMSQARSIAEAEEGDEQLGPLQLLPGTWRSLPGRGWNMIALPFADDSGGRLNYRLLVNQYDEVLRFNLVDKAVPNRGIAFASGGAVNTDQFLATLDYEQTINQIAADDFPSSGKAGGPGLWLHMANETTDGLDIARLATVPHGDSVLALGRAETNDGGPSISDINGLPVGVEHDLNHPYLSPYKHFHDNLFEGLFDPVSPNDLLKAANQGVNIETTTTLSVDSTLESGGISNIPFIVKQANAASMNSHFWIQELSPDASGNRQLRLQYSQVVMLDFFPRRDGLPGVIRWPHVSINTLVKDAA